MRNRLLFWKTCLRIRRQSEHISQDSKHTIKPMEKSTIFEMRSPSNPKTHNENQQPKFQEFWFQHKQHNTFRSKCVCENGSANLCKVPFRFGGVAGELDWPIHHKMRFTYAPLMRHLCAARTRLLGLISGIAPPRWDDDDDDERCQHLFIKSVERRSAMTTYARSHTQSCATHCA